MHIISDQKIKKNIYIVGLGIDLSIVGYFYGFFQSLFVSKAIGARSLTAGKVDFLMQCLTLNKGASMPYHCVPS
jgi:hypothetical protein